MTKEEILKAIELAGYSVMNSYCFYCYAEISYLRWEETTEHGEDCLWVKLVKAGEING